MSCSDRLCARHGAVVSVLCVLLGACSSIMIVSNFNKDIRGYEVGDGTRLNGNVPPYLMISSPGFGVAAYYNTVFVANLSGSPSGSITVFEVGLGGYSSQLPTIAGDATGLNGPLAVAVDSVGNIYVTTDGSSVDNQQKVLVYAKGASGNVAPIVTIAGSNTGLFGPGGIAVDKARRIYVANRGGGAGGANSITVYAPGANGNASPIATITGPNTKLGEPTGIAVDPDGTIFVTNWDFNSVTAYAPGANGDVPPIAVIQGSHTGLFGPMSIAVGFGHRLYVTNSSPTGKSSVTVYPAGADGDVAPLATLTGSAAGLGDPYGIAFACVFANSRWVDGFFPRPPGC
jgi:sugar lactone lactonase YvrE